MTAPTDADAPQSEGTQATEPAAPRARDWVAMLAPVAAGIIAVPGSVSALEAFREGRSLLFFWGQLAALGVLAVMLVATVVLFGWILRHRGVFVTCFVLGMLVMVGLAVSLHTVAFRVPPVVAGGIDLALLAWSVIGVRRLRGAGEKAPVPSAHPEQPAPERATRWAVWRPRLLDGIFVILAAAGCLLTLFGY